ncbi:sialate O-acetylesterase [Pedobacter frigidisoli]|uniref:sialate O-acetylesterase n=1 Tax=Pedobacter frigidisoli TaxID=2530455 RepID=UPI00292FC51D|nr:sialate O-acetylesterase [Pedobacter frigidisoli]
MRFFLLCFLFTFFNDYLNAQEKIEVYLIGGQSNATGQGYVSNFSEDMRVESSVLIFHSGPPHLQCGFASLSWHPLHQASESPDRFGLELGLGYKLHELRPKAKIAIIKHAHSGTNLYSQWDPGRSGKDFSGQGEQYQIFIKTVKIGLDSLRKKGYLPVIIGMAWQQGESDADKGGIASSRYGKNLKRFIHRVRSDLNARKMLFVYGHVYPPPNLGKGILEVRKAQRDIDQQSGSSLATKGAFLVSTDGLSFRANDRNTKYPNDFVHFGTSGIWKLGLRMATEMNRHFTMQ